MCLVIRELITFIAEVVRQTLRNLLPFSHFFTQVHNPLRLLFTLSCVLLLVALIPRFTCQVDHEDHIAVAALIMAWPYSLAFCRYISFLSIDIINNYKITKIVRAL